MIKNFIFLTILFSGFLLLSCTSKKEEAKDALLAIQKELCDTKDIKGVWRKQTHPRYRNTLDNYIYKLEVEAYKLRMTLDQYVEKDLRSSFNCNMAGAKFEHIISTGDQVTFHIKSADGRSHIIALEKYNGKWKTVLGTFAN